MVAWREPVSLRFAILSDHQLRVHEPQTVRRFGASAGIVGPRHTPPLAPGRPPPSTTPISSRRGSSWSWSTERSLARTACWPSGAEPPFGL